MIISPERVASTSLQAAIVVTATFVLLLVDGDGSCPFGYCDVHHTEPLWSAFVGFVVVGWFLKHLIRSGLDRPAGAPGLSTERSVPNHRRQTGFMIIMVAIGLATASLVRTETCQKFSCIGRHEIASQVTF